MRTSWLIAGLLNLDGIRPFLANSVHQEQTRFVLFSGHSGHGEGIGPIGVIGYARLRISGCFT